MLRMASAYFARNLPQAGPPYEKKKSVMQARLSGGIISFDGIYL